MPDQVPEKVKSERSEHIRQIGEENKRKYRSSLLGKTERVLVEKTGDGSARGYGEHYVPVRFPSGQAEKNRIYPVIIKGIRDGADPDLSGELC